MLHPGAVSDSVALHGFHNALVGGYPHTFRWDPSGTAGSGAYNFMQAPM
jgi:hypothetical protein